MIRNKNGDERFAKERKSLSKVGNPKILFVTFAEFPVPYFAIIIELTQKNKSRQHRLTNFAFAIKGKIHKNEITFVNEPKRTTKWIKRKFSTKKINVGFVSR
jgi:hypothetical protein